MVENVNKIPESQDYGKENLVDSDAMNRFEEFKKYFSESPKEEQIRLATQFNQRVNEYMDSELKSRISGGNVETQEESVEVDDSDVENLNKLDELNEAVNAYPNIPEAQKKAIDDMKYWPARRAEDQIGDAIQKDQSDKNIEK